MATADRRSWLGRLMATRERRTALATVAVIVGLVLQVMNLLDVFDGAPAWVGAAVLVLLVLVLAVVIAVAVLDVRERRARRPR
jgi:uncharacterized membrane protein